MTTTPQLRGRFKAKPELDELLAEALGPRHRRAVATRLEVTYECARLWLTGARTVSPDVATRLARLAGVTRASAFTEADACPPQRGPAPSSPSSAPSSSSPPPPASTSSAASRTAAPPSPSRSPSWAPPCSSSASSDDSPNREEPAPTAGSSSELAGHHDAPGPLGPTP